jgi:hypothetical protein
VETTEEIKIIKPEGWEIISLGLCFIEVQKIELIESPRLVRSLEDLTDIISLREDLVFLSADVIEKMIINRIAEILLSEFKLFTIAFIRTVFIDDSRHKFVKCLSCHNEIWGPYFIPFESIDTAHTRIAIVRK